MDNQAEFTFACPHCGQHLAADTDMVGMELECPSCGKALQVPSKPPAQRETPKLRIVPPSDEVPPEKGDFADKAKTALANAAAKTREAAVPILHAVIERWTATTPKNKKRIAIATVCIVALCILIPRMAGSKKAIHGDGQQTEVKPRLDIKPLKTQSKTEAYRAKCIEIKYEDVMRHPGQFIGKDICVRVKVHDVLMPDPKVGDHRGGFGASTDENACKFSNLQWVIVYDDERTVFPDGNVLKGDYATVYGVFKDIFHGSWGDSPRIMARMISTAPAEQAEGESAVAKGAISNPQPPVPAQAYPASSVVLPPDLEYKQKTIVYAEPEPETVNGVRWTYVIKNGKVRIEHKTGSGYSDYSSAVPTSTSGAITVPSTLGGCPVTSIGDCAFKGCGGITSVKIPYGVTSIESFAFKDCSGLTSVTIPDSVTEIGVGVFTGCTDKLFDTKTIPGVKLVDGWAVEYESDLSGNLKLKGVRGIASYAFKGCDRLTSVMFDESVKMIAQGGFENCRSLSSVTIPNGVTRIGHSAFAGCSCLLTVVIPSSVTYIGPGAFTWCNGKLFDTKTIPGVKLVDGWAVGYESGLSGNLKLTGVRGIASCAFVGCDGLTSVTIPNGVVGIGYEAFQYCRGLTSMTIPSSVTSIAERTFENCTSLASVTIPSSVKSIGWGAFKDCTSLASVTIQNGVTSIDESTFKGCTSLASVTIPPSVKSIGFNAFLDCENLTSLPDFAIKLIIQATREHEEKLAEQNRASRARNEEQARRMQKGMAVLGMLSQLGAVAAQQDAAAKLQQEEARRQADALDDWTDAIPSPNNQKPSWGQPQGQPQVQPRKRQQQKEVKLCPICRGTGRLGDAGQALDVPGALTTGRVQPCQHCRGTGVVDRY